MAGKILVSFTSEQREILESLNGVMGHSNSEVIRTIVMSWLSEKGYLVEIKTKKRR